MSIEEKHSQSKVHYMVGLWLKENINDYILEKTVFKEFIYQKQLKQYYIGFIIVREKYSPIRMKIDFEDIYKWFNWRNSELMLQREIFIEKCNNNRDAKLKSPSLDRYTRHGVDISKSILKRIIKQCKGFN